MRFRIAGLNPLKIAVLTSILSLVFVVLDGILGFGNVLPLVFFVLTLVLLVIFIYSKIPELYTTPEISAAAFVLFGILLLVEASISFDVLFFEGGILIAGSFIAFYILVKKLGVSRLAFTIILFCGVVSGIYLRQYDRSVLLLVGMTLWIMPLILYASKRSQDFLRQQVTPVKLINLILNILLFSIFLSVLIVLSIDLMSASENARIAGSSLVISIVVSMIIFLGSLSRFLQLDTKPSKRTQGFWWGITIAACLFVFLSGPLLTGWASFYGFKESLNSLWEPSWMLFDSVLGVSVVLWAHKSLRWQWSAFTIGCLGGALLSVVVTPLAYAVTYIFFVPGQDIVHIQLADAVQWGIGAGVLILFTTIFLGVFLSRPHSRLRAILAASISGTTAAVLLFMSSGAIVAAIASQRYLYGVAYTRVGFDDFGWTNAIAESVLYIHPWVYGMLGSCLAIGLLPALLIGLTWPVKRSKPDLDEVAEQLTPTVPLQLLILSGLTVILIVVFNALDDRIANTMAAVGLQAWWKPEWIVPVAVFFPLLLLVLNTGWIFSRMHSWTPSAKNSILLYFSGLILISDSIALWLIAPEYGLTVFLFLAVGLEIIRHGLRLWKDPGSDPVSELQPRIESYTSFSTIVPTFLITIIGLLPLLVVAVGLALIAIVAIEELRKVTADPPGALWLMQMLANAIRLISTTLPYSFVLTYVFTYSIYEMFRSFGDSLKRAVWWEKSRSLREKLGTFFRDGFRDRKRLRWLYMSWLALGILLIVFLWGVWDTLAPPLFLGSYAYFKIRPDHFRRFSWLTYVVAGLILVAAVLSIRVPLLGSIGILIGPALALIYRGLVVYSQESRRIALSSLFFPLLGIFFALYGNYLQPVSMVQSGMAKFRDGRWETVGSENSPLAGNRNYSFLKDSQNNIWIVGYFGPEALLKQAALQKVRLAFVGSPTVDKLSADGVLLETGGTYFFVNEDEVYGIVQEEEKFVSNRPNRPLPLQDTTDGQEIQYGPNSTSCSSIVIDQNHECPQIVSKITAAAIDGNGDVWLGTDGSGVAQFQFEPSSKVWDWNFFTTENSGLSDNVVIEISSEDSGNIWALTTSGISVLSQKDLWTNYSLSDMGLGNSRTQAVYVDRQGKVWVGSSGGIAMWNGESWLQMRLPLPASIYGFYEDGKDRLWALSTAGAFTYSDSAWSFVVDIPADPFWQNPFGISSFYEMQPAETGIRKAIEDASGNLWFGGPRGLLLYNVEAERSEYFYPSNSGLPSEYVQDIQLDSDNALWVSTYTRNVAHRTAIPIVGFSLLGIVAMLGVIYTGYRRSPHYKAGQIARRLADPQQNLLPEIYRTFSEPHANEVLHALAIQSLPEQDSAGLISAYAAIAEPDQKSVGEKASRLLQVLQENAGLTWQAEFTSLYRLLAQALQVQSVADIGNLHLAVVRSQSAEKVTMAFNNSLPFELPAILTHHVADSLEMLGKATNLLRKYRQVDSPQDRLGFIADSLSSVERAKRDAESIIGPESYFIRDICSLWQSIISRELDALSGHADLRVEFRTRQVKRSEEVTLVLRIINTGSAIANQVQVSLLPNNEIHLDSKTTRILEYIGAGNSETVEFPIKSPAAGDVRVVGEITWSDRIEENNRNEFADVVRFYESTGRFERIPNPYIVGHPVKSASLFQGREDIFDFISQNIQSTTQSRTLVLYGQRRTGKTSILYQLLNGRLGKDYIPILVDVQELAPGIQGMSDLFLELALHLERALKKSGITLEKINEASFATSPTRSFSRLLSDIEGELAGRKIIFMFDEFELLEERILQGKLEPESLGYLRSLMQHKDDLVFIFTGTHKLEQMSKDYWSIFFNIALHQQVSFMNNDDATRLVREPVQGKLSIDDLVVDKIHSLTHGHPYFVQLLCWALVNYCNKEQKNYATVNDLNEVLKEIVSTGDAYFAYIWTQVTPHERIIMSALAERLAPGKIAISVQELVDTIENAGVQAIDKAKAIQLLDGLTNQEILTSTGYGGLLYSYRVGLIGEWVKSSKSLHYLVEREL
jgi:hypothetical protein